MVSRFRCNCVSPLLQPVAHLVLAVVARLHAELVFSQGLGAQAVDRHKLLRMGLRCRCIQRRLHLFTQGCGLLLFRQRAGLLGFTFLGFGAGLGKGGHKRRQLRRQQVRRFFELAPFFGQFCYRGSAGSPSVAYPPGAFGGERLAMSLVRGRKPWCRALLHPPLQCVRRPCQLIPLAVCKPLSGFRTSEGVALTAPFLLCE